MQLFSVGTGQIFCELTKKDDKPFLKRAKTKLPKPLIGAIVNRIIRLENAPGCN